MKYFVVSFLFISQVNSSLKGKQKKTHTEREGYYFRVVKIKIKKDMSGTRVVVSQAHFILFIVIVCIITVTHGFLFGAKVHIKSSHNGQQRQQHKYDRLHKGMKMLMNPPPFEKGESFEFGSDGNDHGNSRGAQNEGGSASTSSSGSCSEMVRLNPCYFDNRRGCQHSNAICPIDGRRCSADRSYLDGEYGPRNIFEDFSILDAINDAAANTNVDINMKNSEYSSNQGTNGEDHLLYTYWGGDLSNNTRRDPDTPYGSHQELS